MQLVYSALKQSRSSSTKTENPVKTKYKAYETICQKYAHEITAIQKYLPDWKPTFNY